MLAKSLISTKVGKSIWYNMPATLESASAAGCLTSGDTTMLTMKQLEKFVKTRNKSGFQSNLQFQIDANDCGFSVNDLGDLQKFKLHNFTGYQWKPMTKDGRVRLVEFNGRLYIGDHDDADTRSMFELMNRADFQVV